MQPVFRGHAGTVQRGRHQTLSRCLFFHTPRTPTKWKQKIAFITSGGTSAPLEKPPMAVRFWTTSPPAREVPLCASIYRKKDTA